MGESLHGCWGDAEGDARNGVEDADRGVDSGDVAENAWPDPVFFEGVNVFAEGAAAVCALELVAVNFERSGFGDGESESESERGGWGWGMRCLPRCSSRAFAYPSLSLHASPIPRS